MDELATRADVSVDTIRFYQARGLLPPPRRQGRVAYYDGEHLGRLGQIRQLRQAGLTLATIRRLVDGELDAADQALATALSAGAGGQDEAGPPVPGGASPAGDGARPEADLLTLEELAERTGIPEALLRSVEREGLLVPRILGGRPRYTEDDVAVARAGLRLLEVGLPLPDVLELARRHHEATRATAEQAVALFDAHVRQPMRNAEMRDEERAAGLVQAFLELLPATVTLVSHHFRRTLLAVAQEHIEQVGDEAEVDAVRSEAARWHEGAGAVPPARTLGAGAPPAAAGAARAR